MSYPPSTSRPGPTRIHARDAQDAEKRRKRGRVVLALSAIIVLVLGAGFVAKLLDLPPFFDKPAVAADYPGPGGKLVIVQVHPGDTAEKIAQTMAAKDVVASWEAFYEAAVQSPAMSVIEPGFYSLKEKMSADEAVTTMVDPTSRVGKLVISEGRQLHDSRDVNTDAIKEGIYTKIAKASCYGAEPQKCVSYQDLDAAGSSSNLAALGVPDWALASVKSVPDPKRQLEGLIAAGSWDFDPTASPVDILKYLVSQSAELYDETGIKTAGKNSGLDPYQMLIAASLTERESLPADFPKVARVIVNRLEVNQPLQFDSTVNYSLDTTEVATTDADRERKTPWNTYAMAGLPATPIASPSVEALKAVESPAPGDWLYFVTIDKQGTTLFTADYNEHLRNIQKALDSGILDSGR